jgi:NTP pyrophosphatase (non-canonical NTP hydrolase)
LTSPFSFAILENVEQDALNTLRDDIHAWHLRNYPKDDIESALLGVGEELGELYRTQLKQDGGIRGTWDEWQAEKRKELGDVMIGLLNVCGFFGVSVRPISQIECFKFFEYSEPKISPKMMLLGLNDMFTRIIRLHGEQTYFTEEMRKRVYSQEDFSVYVRSGVSHEIQQMFLEIAVFCKENNFIWSDVLRDRWNTISKRDFIANPATGGREAEA